MCYRLVVVMVESVDDATNDDCGGNSGDDGMLGCKCPGAISRTFERSAAAGQQ
jgi:hypothetical protein